MIGGASSEASEGDRTKIKEAFEKRELSVEYCEFEMERLGMRGYLVVSENRAEQKQVWRVVVDDEPHVQLGTGAILYPEEWPVTEHPGELAMMCRAGRKLDIAGRVAKEEPSEPGEEPSA